MPTLILTLVLQENRKLQLLRSQLDMYKRQVQEGQMKMADETKRGDKAEFELKRQQEKMVGLQKEKEVGTDGHGFVFVAQWLSGGASDVWLKLEFESCAAVLNLGQVCPLYMAPVHSAV